MSADNTYLLDLYNQLGAELDGYSMNMGALLLKETHFNVDAQSGRLIVGDGIKRACESRRGRIRQLVTHLLAPSALRCLRLSRGATRRCPRSTAKNDPDSSCRACYSAFVTR